MIYAEKPADFRPKFEVVSCYVECDGKFLLLHRQPYKIQGGQWGAPAGKVDEGESILEAMQRELFEETQLDIASKKIVTLQKVFVRYPEYDFVFHMFRTVQKSMPHIVINSKEHQAFQWVTPKESLGMDLIPDMDTCIKITYQL